MSKKKKTPVKTDVKTETNKGWSVPIWVALITGVVSIIGVLFAFPPFQRMFDPEPSPTAVHTDSPAPTNTFTLQPDTPAPGLTFTETYTPTFALTETFTPTATFMFVPPTSTLTPTSGLSIGMQVKITANQFSGRAPLNVTLSAKDSFVRAPDGDIFECRKGGCSYIWYVYVNGEQFIEPQKTNGTLELKLGKRGNYFVSVYICHGAEAPTCASGGTVVVVE